MYIFRSVSAQPNIEDPRSKSVQDTDTYQDTLKDTKGRLGGRASQLGQDIVSLNSEVNNRNNSRLRGYSSAVRTGYSGYEIYSRFNNLEILHRPQKIRAILINNIRKTIRILKLRSKMVEVEISEVGCPIDPIVD